MFGQARLAAVAIVAALAVGSCATGDSPDAADGSTSSSSSASAAGTPTTPTTTATTPTRPTTSRSYAADAFVGVDDALEQRVANAGLSGGFLRIAGADGTVVHEHSVGAVNGATLLDVASTSKWLTAATFMTFVDDHAVALDDDIARWLPDFAGSTPPITPRMLMDHTSGVHDNSCQNGGVSLTACVQTLASSPREFTAGSAFSYGNSPFLVVGRLIEVLGGADFASVVQQRLTGPLAMTSTSWRGAPDAPNPAFGARTTVDDYGAFVAMLLHHGSAEGRRILSAGAVDEIVRNQVTKYDATHDYSVGITGIPRYGLGCWPDVVGTDGTTEVVSGNGGKGFYPWIDFTSRTWGVLGVQDDRGAEVAVPASQAVEVAARTAIDG
jgi:serine-type D-Ala-D-Ala carboxypeptidase